MTGAGGRAGTAPAVFLERQSYRRRRLMDVARLLPILGAALFAVPLLWPRAPRDTPTPAEAQGMPMSDAWMLVSLAVPPLMTRAAAGM